MVQTLPVCVCLVLQQFVGRVTWSRCTPGVRVVTEVEGVGVTYNMQFDYLLAEVRVAQNLFPWQPKHSLNMQWVEMWKCGVCVAVPGRYRTLFHYVFIVFEVL